MHALSLPLVSIVTPAYNEEKYLAECIESVLAQTYHNWEYIIRNNCSKDGTLAIAEKYAVRDPRIVVSTNATFLPALASFNLSLRQISPDSKYCKMVLADDWIFPECLERMVALMEEQPSVGIVGAYGLKDPWVLWSGLPYRSNCVSGREICRQKLLGAPYVFGSQTSLLFRSELVRSHNPFFNESNVHADSEACLELLKDCDFGFVHQILTFSRDDRPGSLLQASRELNTAAAAFLHELVVYGPYYLNPEEYADRLKATVASYYEFLAVSFLKRRNRKFWDYHKKKLEEEGIEFKYSRLVRGLGRRVLREFRRRMQNNRYWGLNADSSG